MNNPLELTCEAHPMMSREWLDAYREDMRRVHGEFTRACARILEARDLSQCREAWFGLRVFIRPLTVLAALHRDAVRCMEILPPEPIRADLTGLALTMAKLKGEA